MEQLTASTLLGLIIDAYKRMATNRSWEHRIQQRKKVDEWLEQLTKLYESGEWMPD